MAQYQLVHFNLNGKDVERMVDVRASLTDMLRNDYHMTSVKKGCEVGECGACNVIIDGECFNSCIYLAVWAEGKHIRTLESLMGPNGELSDIQQAFIDETAVLIPKESYENCFGYYIKYAMRNAMDIATLGTSVNVRLSADKKTVERARVAFGVAGPVPLRAATAEAMAKGQPVSLELAERFAQAVTADINPRDSWRAAKDFRLHIAVESAKRAFIESVKLAGGEL